MKKICRHSYMKMIAFLGILAIDLFLFHPIVDFVLQNSSLSYDLAEIGFNISISILVIGFHIVTDEKQIFKPNFNIKNIGWVFVSILCMIVWTIFVNQLIPIYTENQQAVDIAFKNASSSQFTLFLMAIQACLVAPIHEELIFRAMSMTSIFKKSRFYLDILFSSVIFAYAHVMYYTWSTSSFIRYLGPGLIFAILYRKTASIYYPIAVHVLWNGFLMVIRILYLN